MSEFGEILADFFGWKRLLALCLGLAALHIYQHHHDTAIILLVACCVAYRFAAEDTDKLRQKLNQGEGNGD